MLSSSGTFRQIYLAATDVDKAIREYVEKNHFPTITFPEEFSIVYKTSKEIIGDVKASVELKFFDKNKPKKKRR